jgi:pyridoxal phosphate enzyme (YggS family)
MLINISHQYAEIVQKVHRAEAKYSRPFGSVSVLAVSKSHPAYLIKTLVDDGQLAFGESKLQEAMPKITALQGLSISWHYIGRIQSKKAPLLAEHFDWIHTLSRVKEAQLLSQHKDPHSPLLNICIQIKLDDNPAESGISPDELLPLAKAITSLPNIRLRGLMTIPPYLETFEAQRAQFAKMRDLFHLLQDKGFEIDTLSMGMSHDFEAAIAEGATLVRIGTAIFKML